MSDRLDDAKATASAALDELDTKVDYHDERLRDKYGMTTILARAIDVAAIAVGAWFILDFGIIFSAVGVLLVMGGLFGFLYGGGD